MHVMSLGTRRQLLMVLVMCAAGMVMQVGGWT
jgi:hypothetical protein